MIWILIGIAGLLLLLLGIALIRTLLLGRKVSGYRPAPDPERAARYAEDLSRMVRYETVSVPGEDQREKFLGFHRLLAELFPLVHAHLEKTELDGNLLFCWKGKRSEKPIVLMSHQDVVPALFGAMAYKYFRRDLDIAILPLLVMSLLFVLVPGLISSTSFMILPSGALAIGLAWLKFRKEADA